MSNTDSHGIKIADSLDEWRGDHLSVTNGADEGKMTDQSLAHIFEYMLVLSAKSSLQISPFASLYTRKHRDVLGEAQFSNFYTLVYDETDHEKITKHETVFRCSTCGI